MLVYGQEIVEWCASKMDGYSFDNPFGVGIIKQDKLVGAVVFDNWRPDAKSMCVSIALTDKTALTRGILQKLFEYPFSLNGCNRLMTMIDATNTPSLTLCRALGFTQEGSLRKASPKGNDIAIFGMLRDECRWLNTLQSTSKT